MQLANPFSSPISSTRVSTSNLGSAQDHHSSLRLSINMGRLGRPPLSATCTELMTIAIELLLATCMRWPLSPIPIIDVFSRRKPHPMTFITLHTCGRLSRLSRSENILSMEARLLDTCWEQNLDLWSLVFSSTIFIMLVLLKVAHKSSFSSWRRSAQNVINVGPWGRLSIMWHFSHWANLKPTLP